jgi:hypothetical protein
VFPPRCDAGNCGGVAGLRAGANRVILTAAEHHFGHQFFQLESRVLKLERKTPLAPRVRLVAGILMLLLALFPVLAAITDLVSDFGTGLPTDHQETFAAIAGQAWSSTEASAPGLPPPG